MTYGVFKGNEHIYTLPTESRAIEIATMLGEEFHTRELTDDEYLKRMREIYIEERYKWN